MKSEGRHARYRFGARWLGENFIVIRYPFSPYIGKHRKENR